MTPAIVPRRSVLYMPGSNARALEKAKTLAADALIFDLEDAVAPDEKWAARQQVCEMAARGGYGPREVAIRINGLESPWGLDDLAAVAKTPVAAIVLPKVESADTIRQVAAAIPTSSPMVIWAMIETPRGVQAVESIACAHDRLQVLVMGTSDLAKELRIVQTSDRQGLQYALGRCVLAARAAGLDVIDGVQLDLDNEVALRQVCEQGRIMGFDGKSLIHPKQIAVANEVFSPSPDSIRQAKEIIAAWQNALQQGSGVAVLNGKLVESLHADEARRIMDLAASIERRNAQ